MLNRDKVPVNNTDVETLFDPVELKECFKNINSKEVVPDFEIFDYLFKECMEVGKRIKAQGTAKGHRYSGLMIQFACMLRARCSVDMYEFFRKVFNLPPNSTLCEYSSSDSTSPDGLMMQTIIHMADIFAKKGVPRDDWRRYVNLAWDSHVVKDMLGFCPHTKRLVGYAHDAFDMDVIAAEFKRRYDAAASDDAGGEEENNNDGIKTKDDETEDGLELGKHYMVFLAQTVSARDRPYCFMAARYCLSSLTGRWVRVNKRQITSTLAHFDFIVSLNSFDGASENRSAMKQDLTLSLGELMPDLRSVARASDSSPPLQRHPPLQRYGKDNLPWNFPMAYPHPTREGIIIVSAADTPHAIKKQVNAAELSGKSKSDRNLHLNGLPIQLRMGEDAYLASQDYKSEGAITLFPRLGIDVFRKTSKSRMRFGLAARAFGTSMSRCILAYKADVKKAGPSTYDSYLRMCKETDRFIDIMNAKSEKGCSFVDSPNDPQIFELLNYVKFLCAWREQSRRCGDKNLYFAESTHQDTLWAALSVVFVAREQMPAGCSVNQGNFGTEIVEKSFAASRGKNAHATAQGTDGQMANIGGQTLQNLAQSKGANTEGKRAFRGDEVDETKVKRRRF